MSYPPPPGLKSLSTPQPHPSLPARPPPASGSFSKPSSSSNGAPGTSGAFTAFKPRVVGGAPNVSTGPSAPPTYSVPSTGYGQQYQQQGYVHQHPQQAYYQQPEAYSYAQPTPPQIQNPFPLPGQPSAGGAGGASYDPEMEAQIAQWQSAYGARDDYQSTSRGHNTASGAASAGGANAIALGTRPTPLSNHEVAAVPKTDSGVASVVSGPDGKQKTVVRSGGGQSWQDPSLLEWDTAHFRLFVGNLAGEVTDDSLLKAFSKYDSVQKARVVRDKRTTKSKGYGFVSFSDGDQYFQAVKDMQGKYIGSHPVILKRSTTEIKPTTPYDKNKNKKYRGGKGGGAGGSGGNNAGGHADTGAGIKKPSKGKTWNGLKILG